MPMVRRSEMWLASIMITIIRSYRHPSNAAEQIEHPKSVVTPQGTLESRVTFGDCRNYETPDVLRRKRSST
jgi:hypothetical protein